MVNGIVVCLYYWCVDNGKFLISKVNKYIIYCCYMAQLVH